MRLNHLTLKVLLLTGLLMLLSGTEHAESSGEFPYHLNGAVVKEKKYNYPFEDVWEAALIAVREMRNTLVNTLEKNGFDPGSARILSRKESGLITFRVARRGKRGFLTEKQSLFLYQGVYIEPRGEQETRVLSREIKFISYDEYVFHGGQLARYLDFTPSETNILAMIQEKLQEGSLESR